MTLLAWAEQTASQLLSESLPRRWAHVQGVAATARTLAPVLGMDADTVTAAAWLHDIGYAPALAVAGFHPLDGARHLRDAHAADPVLCRLVAHHSGALTEAAERGLADDLAREFAPPPADLADALAFCDLTTGPDGTRLAVEDRFADIQARYPPGHPVSRAIARSAPDLTAAVARVARRLSGHSAPARPDSAPATVYPR